MDKESILIAHDEDMVNLRRRLRALSGEMGFSLVIQTKLITAASELTRNMLNNAGGGIIYLESLQANSRIGLRMTFEDKGPGIPDIDLAMTDGYSTNSGLGLGLGGSRRLVNEFEIQSTVNAGTTVTITMWSGSAA